jgi:hypothetical protein
MNPRRNQAAWLALVALSLTMLEGCRLVGDVFKAGVWVVILGILLVIGLIAGGVAAFKK